MTAHLCVATGCRTVGHHNTNCTNSDCRGCLPRLAADGLHLCTWHTGRLADDARTAAHLHNELAQRMIGGSGSGEPVSGTPQQRTPSHAAIEARTEIKATLASWCLMIAEERGHSLPQRQAVEQLPIGFIGPPQIVQIVDDTVPAMGDYVALYAEWLAAHSAAADACAELAELAHGRPWRIAHPSGARVAEIGACPIDDCAGTVRAVVRRSDQQLPSEVVCDADDEHRWPPARWHALGKAMSGRAA